MAVLSDGDAEILVKIHKFTRLPKQRRNDICSLAFCKVFKATFLLLVPIPGQYRDETIFRHEFITLQLKLCGMKNQVPHMNLPTTAPCS